MAEIRNDKGSMSIIEAAFVFPIMFIVVLLMTILGNAYYQNSRVTRLIVSEAINGAAICENPMLSAVIEENGIPALSDAPEIKPYRYLFNGIGTSDITNQTNTIRNNLLSDIENIDSLVFTSMKPQNINLSVKYEPSVMISHWIIQCDYEIELPIHMIFSNENFKIKYSIHFEQPVCDASEFVRNVAMIKDYMEQSENASNISGKISDVLAKVAEFVN